MKDRIRERTKLRSATPRAQNRSKKSYKVVAISLYSDQADSVDRAAKELLDAGYRKASRSLVIQAAIERLHEDLIGRTREEILRYFVERQLRRPLAVMQSREQATQPRPTTQ